MSFSNDTKTFSGRAPILPTDDGHTLSARNLVDLYSPLAYLTNPTFIESKTEHAAIIVLYTMALLLALMFAWFIFLFFAGWLFRWHFRGRLRTPGFLHADVEQHLWLRSSFTAPVLVPNPMNILQQEQLAEKACEREIDWGTEKKRISSNNAGLARGMVHSKLCD